MVRESTDSSGIDTSRPDPRPSISNQLQASYRLWLLAIAAGLSETALVVADAPSGAAGSAAEVAVGVVVRLLAFTGLGYLAVQLRQGKNWARLALAVLYGGLGTLSLVIGPVAWLVEGGSLVDAMAAADLGSVLFAASRVVHLGAVIAALVLMFHPAANAYIRATRRTRAEPNHVRNERHPPPTALPSAARDPGRPGRRAMRRAAGLSEADLLHGRWQLWYLALSLVQHAATPATAGARRRHARRRSAGMTAACAPAARRPSPRVARPWPAWVAGAWTRRSNALAGPGIGIDLGVDAVVAEQRPQLDRPPSVLSPLTLDRWVSVDP